MTSTSDISDLNECNRLIIESENTDLRHQPEKKVRWLNLLNQIAEHPALSKLPSDTIDILYRIIDSRIDSVIDDERTIPAIRKIYENSGHHFSYALDQLIVTCSERKDIFFDVLDMIAAASPQSDYNSFGDTLNDCLYSRSKKKIAFTPSDFDRFLQYCRQMPQHLLENDGLRNTCLLTVADLYQKNLRHPVDWEALLKLCGNVKQKSDFWAIDRLYNSLMNNQTTERGQLLSFIRKQTAAADLSPDELPAGSSQVLHILATANSDELKSELQLSLAELPHKQNSVLLARHILNLAEILRENNAISPQEMLNLQQTIDQNVNFPVLLDFPTSFNLLPAKDNQDFLQSGQQILNHQIAMATNYDDRVLHCCKSLLGPNSRRPDKTQILQSVLHYFGQKREVSKLLDDLLPPAKSQQQIEAYFQLLQKQSNYITTDKELCLIDCITYKLLTDKSDCRIPPETLLEFAERNMQNYPQFSHLYFSHFAEAFSSRCPEHRAALTDCIRRNISSRVPNLSKSCIIAANKVAKTCFPTEYLDTISKAPQIDNFYPAIFANLNRQTELNPASTEAVLNFINQRLNIAQKLGGPDFVVFQLEGRAGILHNWQEILLRTSTPTPENLQQFLQICQFTDNISNRMPSPTLWRNAGAFCRQKYGEMSDKERKALIWTLYKSPLCASEKKLLAVAMMQTPDKFTPADYIAIRDYMLTASGFQKGEDIEAFAQKQEWLLPAAVACAQIYGKDFRRYFDAIENYNQRLPKLQEQMAQKERIYAQKIAFLSEKYKAQAIIFDMAKNLPNNRYLAQAKIRWQMLLQYGKMSAEIRQTVRNWQEQIKNTPDYSGPADAAQHRHEAQSILGSIFGTANYIDYRTLSPIDLKKATDWMRKVNPDEAATVRRYFDRHLVAKNTLGQTFLRLDAPHYDALRIHDLEDAQNREENPFYGDDFSLLANRLRYITPHELNTCKYGEIYDRLTGQNFCAFSPEFCHANSSYISTQEDYEKAERIYLAGCLTPSRFSDLPVITDKSGSYRCYVAAKDDVRTLFIGAATSCCQKFGGIGSSCAVDSVVNPYSGCLIFEKKIKDGWRTCGCSWFYESQKGDYKALTFDSLEISNYTTDEDKIFALLQKAGKEFARKNYADINIGCRVKNWLYKQPAVDDNNPLPDGYSDSAYTDATVQKSLFHNSSARPEAICRDVIYSQDIFRLTCPEDENFSAAEKLASEFGSRCLRCKSGDKLVGIAGWNRKSQKAILALDPQCTAPIMREFTRLALQQIRQAGADRNWTLQLPDRYQKECNPVPLFSKERD